MIEQRHEIPLTQAVNKCAPGRGAIIQSLYVECHNLLNNVPSKTSGVTRQRQVSGPSVTATVTDDASGYFLQLSAKFDEAKLVEGPWLAFGRKFLEETKIPQLANTGVKLWT